MLFFCHASSDKKIPIQEHFILRKYLLTPSMRLQYDYATSEVFELRLMN